MAHPGAHVENLVHTGRSIEAAVPDTLDLAERAELALSSLTQVIDPERGHRAYHRCRLFTDPPVMMLPDYGTTCESKILEALPLLRVMCGSDFNADVDAGMMRAHMGYVGEDGLYYCQHTEYPQRDRPWPRLGPHFYPTMGADFAPIPAQGRMMLAMMKWREMDGNPQWDQHIGSVARGLRDIAVEQDDYIYYPDGMIGEAYSYPRGGWRVTQEPLQEASGEEGSMFMCYSAAVRGLARWYGISGDEAALDTAARLVRFMLKPRFWEDVEHAWYSRTAHLHAHVSTLWALLEYAWVTGDEYLKDFVRFGYERARMLGIARLGCFIWTTEACATSDMVALAIRLSELGIGDYWPDVEAYIRNQMTEEQLVDRDLIEEVAGTGPRREVDPPQVISDRVLDRAVGSFATNASPTRIYTGWTICCPANGSLALYYAWESMLRHRDGHVQVNMLLNRVSPWLDVSSWLPYEGKVVMANKSAQSLSVRVPRWVSDADLKLCVNGSVRTGRRTGPYLLVGRLKPGDVVEMTFPVPSETRNYRIEGSIESARWESKEYRCSFRGNTLVDIEPRDEELERDHRYIWDPSAYGTIPIYQRDHFKADRAPMKKASRYVSDRTPAW